MILQMIRLLHYIRAGKLLVSKVGINYVGAALDIATEQAASFRIVQVMEEGTGFVHLCVLQAGLAIGDWVLGTVESITTSEVCKLWLYLLKLVVLSSSGCANAVQCKTQR